MIRDYAAHLKRRSDAVDRVVLAALVIITLLLASIIAGWRA